MTKIIIPPFAQSRFTHSPLIYGGGIRKVAAGGDPVLDTLSFRSSATSTAATIVGPADIEAGDILVLLDRAASKAPPTEVVPTDFTVIDTRSIAGTTRQVLSYKIADGSEASASLTGMDGSNDFKILAVFQGNIAVSSVAVQDISGEMTNGNPASQSITASGGAIPLLVLGGYGSSGSVDPRTWTGGTPSALNNGATLFLLYEIFNSPPADITIDMDDEGAENCLQGCYLEAS